MKTRRSLLNILLIVTGCLSHSVLGNAMNFRADITDSCYEFGT
ncbi:MAG: hypothetical protein RIS79_1282 [Verrucomicrobiota bacterium]|jgi:hypothetical protein